MLVKPEFIIMLLLVLVHQVTQKILKLSFPRLDSYFDPLLFLPILLYLILWERRYWFGKGPHYVLSWLQIATIFVFVSIVAEYFFPRWSNDFTSDYLDVLCYAIGAVLFGVFLNRPYLKLESKPSLRGTKQSIRRA